MRDKISKGWIKGALVFINVVSLSCFIIVMQLLSFISKMDTKGNAIDYGYERIMKHYVASIIEEVRAGNDVYDVMGRYDDSNIKIAFIGLYNGIQYGNRIWNYVGYSGDYFTQSVIITRNCTWGETLSHNFCMPEDGQAYGIDVTNLYSAITNEVGFEVNDTSDNEGRLYYYVEYEQNSSIKKGDLLYEWKEFVEGVYSGRDLLLAGAIILPALFAASTIILTLMVGVRDKKNNIKLNQIDRIPLELLTILLTVMEFVLHKLIVVMLGSNWLDNLVFVVMMLMAAMLLGYILSIAKRVKANKIFRYTGMYHLWKPLYPIKEEIKSNMSLMIKVVAVLSIMTLLQLFALVCTDGILVYIIICFIIYKIFEYMLVLRIAYQMWIIKDGVRKIADGNLELKIDTNKLSSDFKDHAECVNRISDGMNKAVVEQIKSERMKTELITNVSHDIKTPLTSIINYVDLLKKEDVNDVTVNEYVGILDRQSARLKKLIDDLMEASKAATGNLEVNFEECNVKMLLSQALGEFSEKLEAAGLEVVIIQPEEEVLAKVDGRHLWRVFDNLINNICKYAMAGTRVYLSIEKTESGTVIALKNISKDKLIISSDELMERFVRGDGSRNTEGSGLGLSIAKSLTELMNGTMELAIDGDLFKVMLRFEA